MKKALIIGISDYTNLQKLDFCKNDGTEIYEVLISLGYEISDKNKLVGEAKGEKVKDAIYDFFDDIRNIPDDTLLFYYSGHGVPDVDGDMYLASSDTDPDKPYRRGFSFEELTKMIQKSIHITHKPLFSVSIYSIDSVTLRQEYWSLYLQQ
jgi:uncharacterized caspase-like protein